MNIHTVAIVGAGLIGRSWSITFARAGLNVRLYDPEADALTQAVEFVRSVGPDLAEHDLLSGRSVDEIVGSIQCCTELEDALAEQVGWVQECGPEQIDLKREVFAEIDRKAPLQAILASSSSALLPSAIFGRLKGRQRCIVAHPINPPYLVPAVEVVPSPWTDEETKSGAASFMERIGQVPLKMEREIDGFIMNRLQGALLQEAFRLVGSGIASADDVDRGIAEGLALRWSFMGPFETIDLNAPNGIEDYVGRYEAMYAGLAEQMRDVSSWTEALPTLLPTRRAHTPAEDLARRQLWRDRRLMALRKHKRDAEDTIGR